APGPLGRRAGVDEELQLARPQAMIAALARRPRLRPVAVVVGQRRGDARLGVRVERRLYLDGAAPELRGEERFIPTKGLKGDRRRFVPYAVFFPLHPDVRAQVSLDGRSVVVRYGSDPGWRLATDAAEVKLEPAQRLMDGVARGTNRIVLSGLFRLESGGRVRWKLSRG
ncbi:MAG TPA: heparinase II/III family protein, partial [Caulobacteraceae bacterium]|nr:heparinase II/III family protein [Caulobacteraceae bacterium]